MKATSASASKQLLKLLTVDLEPTRSIYKKIIGMLEVVTSL